MINDETVLLIAPDGTFRHFRPPLPKSESNQITLTAQRRKAGHAYDPKEHGDRMMNPAARFWTPRKQELTTQ